MKEVAIWQQFSREEETDKWVQRLVKFRLIRLRPIWYLTGRRVRKRYEYRITPAGEAALWFLNGLTRLGFLKAEETQA